MSELWNRVTEWSSDENGARLLWALASVLVIVVAVRFLQRWASGLIADRAARYRARKIVGLLGYFTVALGLAIVFSDRLGRLSVVLGVAGAGIAFALQEVITSVAGWIAVSLGGFYKVGDRVELGGIRGDVVDIGFLRTTLFEVGEWVDGDLYNGRVVRVANSFIFKEPVVNYSGDFPFLWDELQVPVRFGSDVDKARALLQAATDQVCADYETEATTIWKELQRKYPLEDASTKPMITLAFDHNWVTFTLRYAVRFDRRRRTKNLLFEKILSSIESTPEVTVAASSLEIHSRDSSG
jgi:small-conductance mechanosensitive channel